ncbi:hypothetical protein D039_2365A, partial [Vibrio parahaemolyticus EKP-028]
MAVEGFV